MIWLSTKVVAELLGYEERTIRQKAKDKEYQSRYIPSSTGQGGRKMERGRCGIKTVRNSYF